MHDQPFTVGRFERIYDPSAGEPQKWYVNDHTIARDHTGTWHLIGITHEQIDIPPLEKYFNAPRAITADEVAEIKALKELYGKDVEAFKVKFAEYMVDQQLAMQMNRSKATNIKLLISRPSR